MFRRKVRWVEPQKFDDLFASEADIVDLDDEDSESAYESLDSQLIEHINQALAAIYPQDSAGKAERPYQLEDWWPNHTRYLDVCRRHLIPELLPTLHGLLSEPFHHYRIQLVVYEDSQDGESYIGSIALYRNHMIAEKRLKQLLPKFSPNS